MPEGTSWRVGHTDDDPRGAMIRLALSRGDVRWKGLCEEWLDDNFDVAKYTKAEVHRLMLQQANSPGGLHAQYSPAGSDHEIFYYVEVTMDGKLQFIKFVLDPEDSQHPQLFIVSTHRQYR